MTYDVDYFIKKFEAIPEESWCTEEFEKDGDCCALGHCGISTGMHTTIEADELTDLFFVSLYASPGHVNDGLVHMYSQPTPKQRILAALHDIKKLQTKES